MYKSNCPTPIFWNRVIGSMGTACGRNNGCGLMSNFFNKFRGCCSTCNLLGALKNTTPSSGEINLFDKAQLQFCHLPLQKGVYPWQVLCPDVSQQNCINTIKVPHQLPETGLSVRASVHQYREAIYSKEGTVTTAGREHIAAGTRQLEETDGCGRRQEWEIQRARLQRGVLCASEPQVGAAAGGREEESPSADHGAETQRGGILLFSEWMSKEGLEVSCSEKPTSL
ncbi:hypothetical protein INR49_014307 [Caranx melampygus]|nr:hypothetical protein INR49_014307 [Caranx melampygus]